MKNRLLNNSYIFNVFIIYLILNIVLIFKFDLATFLTNRHYIFLNTFKKNFKSFSSDINELTYINTSEIVARQIDNTNIIQSYSNDYKKSVLSIHDLYSNKENYNYDSYGNNIKIPNKSYLRTNSLLNNIPNYFQYNGEYYDPNTGLEYLRARFYNPITKRFLSEDNYNFFNRFNYAAANPIMHIDPTGNVAADYIETPIIDKSIQLHKKEELKIKLIAENLYWDNEKILNQSDVCRMFKLSRKANISGVNPTCLPLTILFGISNIGISKPVSIDKVAEILCYDPEITIEKFNMLGRIIFRSFQLPFFKLKIYYRMYESFHEFFKNNSTVGKVILFNDNHVSLWIFEREKSDFQYSYWLENGNCGLARYSIQSDEEKKYQDESPVFRYIILE